MTIIEKKSQVGMLMGDSLRQIIKKSQSIIERMAKDGVESCASADLDILYDAIHCWKQAQTMHILNNMISEKDEQKQDEPETQL
jgi:hypothetical protein